MTHRDTKIVTGQEPQVSPITIFMWGATGNTRGSIRCALVLPSCPQSDKITDEEENTTPSPPGLQVSIPGMMFLQALALRIHSFKTIADLELFSHH